jgi:methylmalonyl-CoA mutase cobalamin-binding domain/chain
VDEFAGRLSFFFAIGMNFFMEAAKLRAARRLWHRIMTEFGAKRPESLMLRTHCQTSGVSLQEQDPYNNIVRTAYEALAAALGGTQSLHTNSYDEALGLPTADAATLALRTQQILAGETGVPDTADPLAGSYFVERLTDELDERARDWLRQVAARGGAVAAIESGFVQNAIAENAFQREVARERGEDIVVGVNRYATDDHVQVPLQRIDDESVRRQIARVRAHKETQDRVRVEQAMADVTAAAVGAENLLPPMREALRVGATLGQIGDALRVVFGEYRASS